MKIDVKAGESMQIQMDPVTAASCNKALKVMDRDARIRTNG